MQVSVRVATLASLLATLAAACTNHGGSEVLTRQEPGSEQDPPVETPAASTVSPSDDEPPVWRWIHHGDEGGPKTLQAGRVACTFEHDPQAHDAGKVCCEGPSRRWCVEMREDFVPGISLASDGRLLFVADHPAISSGARFAAYELETGTPVWTREALAIGPQEHSEYWNVVQLRLIDELLIAYGDEAHGAYVETMDPATGELREHATLNRPHVEWRWSDAEPTTTIELEHAGACRLAIGDRGPAQLDCEPVAAPAWTRELDGDFVGRGALASDGQRVVVITWSPIANGARARAWALADGALLWDRPIEGIGPQDHSKYSNQIQLDLTDELVVVTGSESHGRYVEALDLATGTLRWTISWPPLRG